jgi:hypothetical protein
MKNGIIVTFHEGTYCTNCLDNFAILERQIDVSIMKEFD